MEDIVEKGMNANVSRREFIRRVTFMAGGIVVAGPVANILAACGGDDEVAVATATRSPVAMAEKKLTGPIRSLAWTDKDHPDVKAAFLKQHDVDVVTTQIEDNTDAFAKLKVTGTGGYDQIFFDGLWAQEYHRNGFVEPFDFPSMNSYPEFFPSFADFRHWQVTGEQFSHLAIPHTWSPNGITYNSKLVSLPDPPSFEVLFDPKYKGKVALRGIPSDALLLAASLIGYEDFEVDTPDGPRWDLPDDILKRAKDELIRAKANFVLLWKGNVGDAARALATEEIVLSLGMNMMGLQAADAGNPNIDFVVPKERTIGWVDGHMLVKNAKNKEATLLWMDHWASAENQVIVTKANWQAPLNRKTLELLQQEGLGERVEKLKAFQAEDWVETFSLFRPLKDPGKFADAWAEFLAA